jgi:hypothetical protein
LVVAACNRQDTPAGLGYYGSAMIAKLAPLLSLLLLPLLLACSSTSEPLLPGSPSAEIPIRRVVLYQNGVGYFERRGKLDGNVFALQARPAQINDLLKSLTVIDLSQGRAVSVSLPLEQRGDRVLSQLPKQVREAGGILDVLTVFRGARVEVVGRGHFGTVTGRIVGVEDLRQKDEHKEEVVPDWRLTIKTADGDLVVYPVTAIERISIQDRTLSVGLEQSLDVSLNEGNWKPVWLSVRLAGEAPHDLLATYIVEMPRWKPAYRMVLGKAKQPLLQGWAVVDNVSGEDWIDVQLSLVAGTPMSFVYDLHSPQYTSRVDLTPRAVQRAVAPPRDEPGITEKDRVQRVYAGKRRASKESGPTSEAKKTAEAPEEEDYDAEQEGEAPSGAAPSKPAPVSLDDTLQADAPREAKTQKMGALFRYDIQDPVTIPDRSSTLVAIVNQRVNGEEVVYFRPELTGGRTSHPYRAVRLRNDTGSTLETGPIAVYSDGTFVGEGFLERMEASTTSMLTFAIDSHVVLETDQGARDESVRLIKIIDGQLVSEVLRVETITYAIDNRHRRAITAFVKTPKRTDWKLKLQPTGTVVTSDALLVPLRIDGGSKAKLKLEWTKRLEQRVAVDSSSSTTLLKLYLSAGSAPPHIAKVIREVLDLKRQVSDLNDESQRLNQQHGRLSADQDRVRKNLNLLRKTKGNAALKAELTRKLARLEDELGRLSGRLVAISEKTAELVSRMKVLIRSITLGKSD